MTPSAAAGSSVGRRAVLAGVAAAGAAAVLGACGRRSAGGDDRAAVGPTAAARGPLPFAGAHQAAVTTRPPAAQVLVAADVTAADRTGLAATLGALSDAVRRAMDDGGDDGVGVIVSVGPSLFNERFGLAGRRPRQLVAMAARPNDELDPGRTGGDVLLTIGAADRAVAEAVLAAVLAATADGLVVRWREDGSTTPDVDPARGRTEVRNRFGFKDGTANLDPDDEGHRARFVRIGPDDGEPVWAVGASYHTARTIRMDVAAWSATPVAAQEAAIGRVKATGAPLGGDDEDDPVLYAADPDGAVIPLDAHIRRATPGVPETAASALWRRSVGYTRPAPGGDGPPEEGMLFACFDRDLGAQFLAVQARLDGEPMEAFTTVVGGGHYLALPGPGPAPDATLGAFLLA